MIVLSMKFPLKCLPFCQLIKLRTCQNDFTSLYGKIIQNICVFSRGAIFLKLMLVIYIFKYNMEQMLLMPS